MTIGELAKQAGVTTRTLRHYEELGLLSPERARSGYRLYRPEDVATVRRIRLLLDLGLSLKQIRRVHLERPQGLVETQLARVESELRRLEGLKSKLVRLRQSLEEGTRPGSEELLSSLEVLSMMDQPDHDPVVLEIGSGLIALVNQLEASALLIGLKDLRRKLHDEGIFLPGVRIRDDASLAPDHYRLTLFQQPQPERRLEASVEPMLEHLHELFRQNRARLNLLR